MSDPPSRPFGQSRPEGKTPYVTSAVGLEGSASQMRARRATLFTRTIVWVTGLVCLSFLIGALLQAWTNSQLMQDLQHEQQVTSQLQRQHIILQQMAQYYQDPYVIESEARQHLGYARAGEHVIIVVGTNDQEPSHPSAPTHHSGAPGFWQDWWNIFFG